VTGTKEFVTAALSPALRPRVKFDDVAGLEDAKREIHLRTLLPLKYPAERARYRLAIGGGVLLWGPPGCGKTLLARAVAGELEAAFFHKRASDLMSSGVGDAEKNVAAVFQRVRQEPRAVLFLDEIDALCPSRRRTRSTIMVRVISEFLSQTDGLERSNSDGHDNGFLLLVGATNWPESLDEALMRPGRFDVQAFVDLPDLPARRAILSKALAGRPVDAAVSVDELASQIDGLTGADLVELVESAARAAFLRSIRQEADSPPLSWEDIETAHKSVKPSVSAEELARYKTVATARGNARVQRVIAHRSQGLKHEPDSGPARRLQTSRRCDQDSARNTDRANPA
jgi:SpoVK/Ycf46/Vps4 family AAA+-type ATPase